MYTIATAIDRITAENGDLFLNFSPAQALQRINRIISAWYESASWRGVKEEITFSSVSGLVTLDEEWLRLEKRIVALNSDGCSLGFFEIKPLEYKYQTGGPGYFQDDQACCLGVAIDKGDSSTGQRRYQLTGDPDVLDTYTLSAIARKRYVYATDLDTIVVPDCYSALELAARAMKAQDDVASDLAADYWAQSYAALDGNIGQFEEGNELGVMQIDRGVALTCGNMM